MSSVAGARCFPPTFSSSTQHHVAARPYVTNDVTPSTMATTAAAAGSIRETGNQPRDWLAALRDDEEEENSGSDSASTGAKLLRLVSRDVVRFDT